MKITICGSATFVKDMRKAQKYLEEKGHEVFVPNPLVTEEWYQENHGRENFLQMKPIWTQKHFKRIENSNAVLILNNEKKEIAGYLGPNTLMELSVAFYLGKKIFFMNSLEENHPYYEELIAMNSIILDGDLSKVK
jgi:hypothetical protein